MSRLPGTWEGGGDREVQLTDYTVSLQGDKGVLERDGGDACGTLRL